MSWQGVIAAVAFVVTFLLLALGRLGRIPVPRGVAALVGGLLTKFLLAVPWRAIDIQVLLLLAGLMALAGLGEAAGLFAGIRRRLVHLPSWLALWVSTLLVAVASALVLLDAAVVVLVPFLLPSLLGLGLPAVPVVTLLAVGANVGSLLTPFGNPQNAVLASAADLSVESFLVRQGPIVLVGFALLGVASRWAARKVPPMLPEPHPYAVPRGRPWLLLCLAGFLAAAVLHLLPLGLLAVLAAVAAYFGLRPLLGGEAAGRAILRGIDLNILALFVGLYLLTGGLRSWVPDGLTPVARLDGPAVATAAVTLLSNLVGNVPAILTLLRLDEAWTILHAPFLVTVSTLGGTLLLTGSAASLIAADQARRLGTEVAFLPFLRTAVPIVLPLLLFGAALNWT